MAEYKINPHQHRGPIGGHHFKDGGTMFRGETPEAVAEKVRDFRIANGRPLGDPLADITLYYAKNFPWMVMKDFSGSTQSEPNSRTALVSWIRTAWSRPPAKFVTDKDATARCNICLSCPHNIKITHKLSAEEREAEKRSFILRKGLDVPNGVGYCDVHKWDTRVMAFVDEEKNFSERRDAEVPKACWAKS